MHWQPLAGMRENSTPWRQAGLCLKRQTALRVAKLRDISLSLRRSKLVLSFRRDCRTRIMNLPTAAIQLASVVDKT